MTEENVIGPDVIPLYKVILEGTERGNQKADPLNTVVTH